MLYRLHNECPVPWTAVQERTVSREFPAAPAEQTAAQYVSRTYYQFLWLPESIMPLLRLTPALLLAPAELKQPDAGATIPAPEPWSLRLHSLLRPLLQTPRSISQKYRTRVSQILLEEETEGEFTLEDELMCFALKYDKDEGTREDETELEAQERWRKGVLDRMEKREVMMQILVHMLLLTLPPPHADQHVSKPSSSPKKRRRRAEPGPAVLSSEALEAHLEMLMDKLAMWQLMASLEDSTDAGRQRARARAASAPGRRTAPDERDGMQAFCEDTVERLFRAALPAQCALLRSKLFRSSPFADDSDAADPASPPGSPAPARSASRTPSRAGPDAAPARTRSLSASLEAERRSRSLSVGPARRALTREVSMTTGFRGKARAPPQDRTRGPTAARAGPPAPAHARARARHGTTLVAATPVKPRPAPAPARRDVLPMLLDNPDFLGQAVEGGADDAEWTLARLPRAADAEEEEDEEDGPEAWLATPTKRRRS